MPEKNAGCFLGIDTSNYTTSLSLCDLDGKVFANIKKLLDVKGGERGLRQSDALFAHTRNLPELSEKLRGYLKDRTIKAIGVSARPRDAEDSYMPCFLAGVSAAKVAGAALGCEVFEFSHQSGHIMAALYSSGRESELYGKEFCAFHVSGGTTDIVHVTPDADGGFSVENIGGSADLNAGQCIDRAGVMMGLGFPCGREMEKIFDRYEGEVPKPKICVDGLSCNLSGLENLAGKLWRESGDAGLVSGYVFEFVAATLIKLSGNVKEKYGDIPLLFAGGVMSNRYIKKRISGKFDAGFAEPEFSADNAAGVALLCRKKFFEKI